MVLSIIGITGRKFNGKDTLGNILHEKYGYKCIAFADPLKNCCKAIFHFTNEQLYGNEKEKIDNNWKTTPRIILQFVGTELLRNQMEKILPDIGCNIWIKSFETQIEQMIKIDPCLKIVVTDIRFQNELDCVKNLGGKIIKIIKPDVINTDSHVSENNIDNFIVDHVIINDGTIDDLIKKIDLFVETL